MDQRKIDSILYDLNEEKDCISVALEQVKESLKDTTLPKDKRTELEEEKENLEYELHEVELDIGVYTEMMNKFFPMELGICGYSCDSKCMKCSGGYDSRYEVFTEGDY
jgi:hypothetical protein